MLWPRFFSAWLNAASAILLDLLSLRPSTFSRLGNGHSWGCAVYKSETLNPSSLGSNHRACECLIIQLLPVAIENLSCAQHDNERSHAECFHLHKRLVDDGILRRLQLRCKGRFLVVFSAHRMSSEGVSHREFLPICTGFSPERNIHILSLIHI